jgi:hypothetical protein
MHTHLISINPLCASFHLCLFFLFAGVYIRSVGMLYLFKSVVQLWCHLYLFFTVISVLLEYYIYLHPLYNCGVIFIYCLPAYPFCCNIIFIYIRCTIVLIFLYCLPSYPFCWNIISVGMLNPFSYWNIMPVISFLAAARCTTWGSVRRRSSCTCLPSFRLSPSFLHDS